MLRGTVSSFVHITEGRVDFEVEESVFPEVYCGA
jgi:hypothetical protein